MFDLLLESFAWVTKQSREICSAKMAEVEHDVLLCAIDILDLIDKFVDIAQSFIRFFHR